MGRRKSSGGGVSLFPFLSILCCLIGLLTLMIKIISDIKSMERGQNQEEIARALENQKIQREIQARKQALEKLRKELEDKGAATVTMRELEDRRVVLRRELEKTKQENPEETDAALQRRIELLVQQIAALVKERPPLDETIVKLTKELEERKIDANAKAPPVIVQPRGLGAGDVNLWFVECEKDGLVIRKKDGSRVSVSKAAITTEPALAAFFNEAKSDKKSMVLFLLRTDGNESYNIAAGWAEHQFELRTAKLPIPNKGDIDLSRFNR
jgi:hypothetical protein